MAKQIAVKGLDKLVRQFEQFGKDAKKMAQSELEDGAREVTGLAKKLAPKNLGKLRQGIQFVKDGKLRFEVIAKESYSGYVEFGTGIQVDVPAELTDVALKIKNQSRGDFDEFLESIKDWCEQKGIRPKGVEPDEQDFKDMYFLIAQSILHKGQKPRPFLYPAWKEGSKNTEKRLNESLDKLTIQFNRQK